MMFCFTLLVLCTKSTVVIPCYCDYIWWWYHRCFEIQEILYHGISYSKIHISSKNSMIVLWYMSKKKKKKALLFFFIYIHFLAWYNSIYIWGITSWHLLYSGATSVHFLLFTWTLEFTLIHYMNYTPPNYSQFFFFN